MTDNQKIRQPSPDAVPTTPPSQRRDREEEPNTTRGPSEGSVSTGVDTETIQPGKTQGANLA